jgi:hypothetical protein
MNEQIGRLLNSFYNVSFDGVNRFSVLSTVPDDPMSIFSIYIAHDGDIHVMPCLNPDITSLRDADGNMNDIYQDMFFSFEQYPTLTGFLKIAARAIGMDNMLGRISSGLDLTNPVEIIQTIISEQDYPEVLDGFVYSRLQDDNDGEETSTLDISFDSVGAYVKVRSMDSLRYRTGYGGGKSDRLRNSLLLICYIIHHNLV